MSDMKTKRSVKQKRLILACVLAYCLSFIAMYVEINVIRIDVPFWMLFIVNTVLSVVVSFYLAKRLYSVKQKAIN